MGFHDLDNNKTDDKKLPQALLDAVRAKAVDGRLECGAARALAAELGVSLAEMGEIANALGIKIKNCQLGCF